MGNPLYQQIDAGARQLQGDVVAWRHHLHANPELPNREVETARYIDNHLRTLELDEIHTDVGGHGVVGVLRGAADSGRTILLRADIDALPVRETAPVAFASTVIDEDYPGGPFPVAHACGHDCHTAMLMGAAQILAGLRAQLRGTVLFVFQPAEEGPPVDEDGGARAMVASGLLDEYAPTMAFGMHVVPAPKKFVGYRAGPQYAASILLKIRIQGHQVHGSSPWMGKDPMPAAAAIVSALGQLYRQVPATEPVTISIGHVEDVGRFNIIGEHITLWGTARVLSAPIMASVQEKIQRAVEHVAEAYGCRGSVEFLQAVPPVVNTPPWLEAAMPTFKRVAGANLGEVPPTLGYDDVSEFIGRYGGLYVMLGVQDVDIVDGHPVPTPGGRGIAINHNPGFYADDDAMEQGVRLHCHVAVDHLAGMLDAKDTE